ncbi:MAG: sialidase family protein [Nitrospiraceae bacterium]
MQLLRQEIVATGLVFLAMAASSCVGPMRPTTSRVQPPQLTAEDQDVWQHAIAASGERVHFVWGASGLFYRRSLDEGETWSQDHLITSDGELHLTDSLAASGHNVYIVYLRNLHRERDWCCERTLGDIYLRRSSDGGLSWTPEQRLTAGAGAFRLSMAVTDSRVDLVWSDFRNGQWQIYYLRSRDAGVTWNTGQPIVLVGEHDTGRAQVASVGEAIHIVWSNAPHDHAPCYTMRHCPEVYYLQSIDGGDTWSRLTRLTFDQPFSGRPDIAVISDTVLVSYDEDKDNNESHEQHLLRSSDGGRTWEPSVRLSTAPGVSDHGSLIASNGTVHLAWHDGRDPDNMEIYYRYSTDRGLTWSAEENLSRGPRISSTPLLAATTHYLHAIWLDRRTGTDQVWYHRRHLP